MHFSFHFTHFMFFSSFTKNQGDQAGLWGSRWSFTYILFFAFDFFLSLFFNILPPLHFHPLRDGSR